MEWLLVSSATIQKDMAKIAMIGVDHKPGNAARIFQHLAKQKVSVNDIIQTEVSEEKANLSFTVNKSDLESAQEAIAEIQDSVHCQSVFVREDVAEISVVGVGMRSHYGVADGCSRRWRIRRSTSIRLRPARFASVAWWIWIRRRRRWWRCAMRSNWTGPPPSGASRAGKRKIAG